MAKRVVFVRRSGKSFQITYDTEKDELLCSSDGLNHTISGYLHRTNNGEEHYYVCKEDNKKTFSDITQYTHESMLEFLHERRIGLTAEGKKVYVNIEEL